MQYRPEAKDILQAVQELLMKEVIPKIEGDDLLSYKTLVSWNMLGVIVREMDKEDEFINEEYASFQKFQYLDIELGKSLDNFKTLSSKEKSKLIKILNQKMAKEIRSSKEADPKSESWSHIKATLKNNLSISNPRFAT